MGAWTILAIDVVLIGLAAWGLRWSLQPRKKVPTAIPLELSAVPMPAEGELITHFFDRCSEDPHMIRLYPNETLRMHACDAVWRLSQMHKPLSSSGQDS